jgi:hypothetical protein
VLREIWGQFIEKLLLFQRVCPAFVAEAEREAISGRVSGNSATPNQYGERPPTMPDSGGVERDTGGAF